MAHSALLVMDVQRSIVDRFDDDGGLLPRLAEAVGAARSVGLPVIHVVVGFRPGHPEVSPRNQVFNTLAGSGRFTGGDPGAEIHPDVAPRPDEVVVTKRRVSAFAGSDLDMVLRAGGIDHLVLSGIATSGVVLSTLRQAADLDYRLTVLADGCLDSDPEVHDVLTGKVFPRQAAVLSVAEWAKDLAAYRS
ncbi:isochorismatase [Streptomyces yokosukanensis]|uniref:Isochorismatase n=1 Tax=Streptomyces yokosukanensis TaxID=67386 RepID=A0A101NXR3_9ACTN|nr:isochorismatase family cysteine hydrolase [Streptomyces yokosukanensis]KUN01158.1 isochorismatase [Streptomyces yokosukanensis]